MKPLPRTVVALGIVSLLTDVSSEMIFPLLPAFLLSLGATGVFLGLIEGLAETTAAFLKLASGVLADRTRKKPWIVLGYGIASFVRPLVALAQAPWHVLLIRFTDRLGKGIRTSPRDALIAGVTSSDHRGAAYGFHRAMDHAGALIGPLIAYVLLAGAGAGHRSVFALAAVPAALAMIVLIFTVRETRPAPRAVKQPRIGGPLPRPLRLYLLVLFVFTLGNSTDLFLIARSIQLGVLPAHVPLLWALFHAIKSVLSTPLGALSDRLGRKRVIISGWLVYAVTYAGFARASAAWQVWALFALYGAHYAFVEGAEKALVADLSPPEARGRAFGTFHFFIGLAALPASLLFGFIWDRVSPSAAFAVGASLGLLATLGFVGLVGRAAHRPPLDGPAT